MFQKKRAEEIQQRLPAIREKIEALAKEINDAISDGFLDVLTTSPPLTSSSTSATVTTTSSSAQEPLAAMADLKRAYDVVSAEVTQRLTSLDEHIAHWHRMNNTSSSGSSSTSSSTTATSNSANASTSSAATANSVDGSAEKK